MIVAVDPFTRTLLWANVYRNKSLVASVDGGWPQLNPGYLTMNWKTSAPVIADGKVVFTAPDGGTLHCLNLKDGKQLWMANWEGFNPLKPEEAEAGYWSGAALAGLSREESLRAAFQLLKSAAAAGQPDRLVQIPL